MNAPPSKEQVQAIADALRRKLAGKSYFMRAVTASDDAGAHVDLHVARAQLRDGKPPRVKKPPFGVRICVVVHG